MGIVADIRINRAGVGELLKSVQVQDGLAAVAERVKANAETLAPRSGRAGREGLAASHTVVRGTAGRTRTRVFVTADTPSAAAIAAREDNWLQRALDATQVA